MMGAVRYSDKKRIVDFISKGTGATFFQVLSGFYMELKAEWAGIDRSPEEFEIDGPKVVIVLDNSSIHKNEEMLEKIRKEMPNLVIEFLPEYSPDYNLVELVWHSTKEFIANRLFESIEALESLVHKLINEGELIINWSRNIKNKGNAINAV